MPSVTSETGARAVAEALAEEVEAAAGHLRTRDEPEVSRRPAPGKWSPKEILGHLIDSAANNHQRFVRAQGAGPLHFLGYEQDEWVRRQRYEAAPWVELVELWRLHNRHLARVIAALPAAVLGTECQVGSGEPVTVGFIVEDYLAHLRHHLRQLV